MTTDNFIKAWSLIAIGIITIELSKYYIDSTCGRTMTSCGHAPIFPEVVYELAVFSGIAVIMSQIYYEKFVGKEAIA